MYIHKGNNALANIGYARVSTGDQDLALQEDALRAAECEPIYSDRISGAKTARPELDKALAYVRRGDTFVVWRLDRLGRSLPHLIETVRALQECGVAFKSLNEQIDTTTANGRLIFHLFGALAQFERDLIRERTRAGLEAAAARGRNGGRRDVMTPDKARRAEKLLASGLTVAEAAKRIKVSRSRLYNAISAGQVRRPAVRRAIACDIDAVVTT